MRLYRSHVLKAPRVTNHGEGRVRAEVRAQQNGSRTSQNSKLDLMIDRTFRDISEDELSKADQQSFLISMGWARSTTWEDLLRSRRILMISEAGAGKTHECQAQARHLWEAGEAAFFIELAALATDDLRSILDNEEETRLDAWLSSQSDVATFFLDSIDELKLSRGSFEQALKRLSKCIGRQLGQARIIVTTRPIPFDEQKVRRLLPIPPAPSIESNEERFATVAMGESEEQLQNDNQEEVPEWRTVALMPLSDDQIVEFARDRGIDEPGDLLEDLQRRNAEDFARRPQDLIELCADWREHNRIRTHRDQVKTNVRVKLLPREDRPELAELSVDKAMEGASRLALAMQLTRRLTIRHSAASDVGDDGAALDPAVILPDWQPNERKALLERPLFGFASYGRVRFHHRSVVEFLAAEQLVVLLGRGMPFRALKRLLFAETKGKTVVRPSKRPVAGWLALRECGVFELLRDNEPAILLNEGDPESLSQNQRNQALRAYADRYGPGGWRGLGVPRIQVHRFASNELAGEINGIWQGGVENPDVREVLVNLIGAGRVDACADIAYQLAYDAEASIVERITALDALVALDDERLSQIPVAIVTADSLWPDRLACAAVLRLFPKYMSVEQLCQTLGLMKPKKRSVGDLSWQLPRLIENAELDQPRLAMLRDGLLELVSGGLHWQRRLTRVFSDRADLSGALAAVCVRGLVDDKNDDWFRASVLALRVHHREYSNDKAHDALREYLKGLNAEQNARLFWAEDFLIQSLEDVSDPWRRLSELLFIGGFVELRADRDLPWVKEALADTARAVNDRAMLLEAAIYLSRSSDDWLALVSELKKLVSDQPSLLATIDKLLRPQKDDSAQEDWEKKAAKRNKQQEQQAAEDRESWVTFWREVEQYPERVFGPERSENTVWALWRAMRNSGLHDKMPDWNRRFIEEQFGKETADRLRRVLMKFWREDRPTLASERPEDKRGTYLIRWQIGLAAIYAEAEDPSWAKKLTEEEATLAARYAPMEFNGLPIWMESLVSAHPNSVDATLGEEMSWALQQCANEHGHSMLLQSISYAPAEVARVFLPRLRAWLGADGDPAGGAGNVVGRAVRLQQVIDVMLKHGSEDDRAYLLAVAIQRLQDGLPDELVFVWLPTLMRIDPELGTDVLEQRIRKVEPAKGSEAVTWFSVLFGHRRDAIGLQAATFTPNLLLRLLRLAYQHVRPTDDAQHEGSYEPDTRDDAESARNSIVQALLDAKGEEAFAAKQEMASDPLCAHFKDRILAIAEENWAQEIDADVFSEARAVALDKAGEAPASTNEAMFEIMRDRLSDLDELLLRDDSPREAWALIAHEPIMRKEIARELGHAANGVYKVDQEAVTADEKETDVRLRSTVSDFEAVIELKLADGRSARDLRDTIQNQLVKKYMAPENRRSGCLLMTLAKDRKWKHPESGKRIGVSGLMTVLSDEAKRVEEMMGGTIALHIHLLDLCPRLPIEKNS